AQNAFVLFFLWIVSTAFIETRLMVALLFVSLAMYETARSRGQIIAFSAFRETLSKSFRRSDA
ncbi:MAG TPA: hypothetical protein VFV92_07825, partial [Candidatus Bathyarchaeia archaeon]|nr:hypothetical protein [Candidatus Bathyarchaeia archaeon]